VRRPYIGAIVLYCVDGNELAAIVTAVFPQSTSVCITVFSPSFFSDLGPGPQGLDSVLMKQVGVTNRCWRWPDITEDAPR